MANVRYTAVSPVITRLRPGDVIAVDNVSSGSAQISLANLGCPIDFGVLALNNATTTLWTVNFTATLAAAPTSYNLTFMAPSGNVILPMGIPLLSSSLTQFQIQLLGPIGDILHSVRWEAFQ